MTAFSIDINVLDSLIQRKQRRLQEMKRLEIELNALRQARYEMAGRAPVSAATNGPTDAVIDFLRSAPAQHTSQQVAEMLRSKVFSKSDDPRRVIISTVSNLVRDGVIERDSLGRLSLNVSEVALGTR